MLEKIWSVASGLTSEGLRNLRQGKTSKGFDRGGPTCASGYWYSSAFARSESKRTVPTSSPSSDDLPTPSSPNNRQRRRSTYVPPEAMQNYLRAGDTGGWLAGGCKPDNIVCCKTIGDAPVPASCKENIANCKDTKIYRSYCTNPVDGALGKAPQKDGLMALQGVTVSVGLPQLFDSGWQIVDEPDVMKELTEEVEKEYFQKALDVHGMQMVQRGTERKQHMMMTFRKIEIPGTAADVKGLSETLKKINHQHVVRLLDACEDDDCVYFVYEGADGAGFLPMLHYAMPDKLGPPDAARILQQISAAVIVGNKMNLNQLDWSLWHIMSSTYKTLSPFKLFGIGLAGVMHNGRRSPVSEPDYLLRESVSFMSPEMAFWMIQTKGTSPYTHLSVSLKHKESSDVFGLGAVAYTIATGHTVYGGVSEGSTLQRAQAGKTSFGIELANIEDSGQELIETMLHKQPEIRPPITFMLSSSWVLYTARQGEGEQDARRIVARLYKFAQMDPVLRALSGLVAKNLRSEKQAEIEEAFRMLDLNGDGEVDIKELTTVAAEKEKVRAIFKAIDKDGTNSLDLEEFIQGNVYAEEILTERTLRATFAAMDQDGSGCITLGELLQTLRSFESAVGPREVLQFMSSNPEADSPRISSPGSPRSVGSQDADEDFDKEIDFEEFRLNFPWIKSRKHDLDKRVNRSAARQKACQETYDDLEKRLVEWLDNFRALVKKLENIHEENDKPNGGDKHSAQRMASAIKAMIKLIKHQPKLELAPGADKALAEVTSAQNNRRKSQQHATEELSLTKIRRQQKKMLSELSDSGCMSLCHPLFSQISSCLDEFFVLYGRAERSQFQESRSRRKHAIVNISSDALALAVTIIDWGDNYVAEQRVLLEACGKDEGRLHLLPPAMRGLKVWDDDETEVMIKQYRKERDEDRDAQEKKKRAILAARQARRNSDASLSPGRRGSDAGSVDGSDAASSMSSLFSTQSPLSSPRTPTDPRYGSWLKVGRRRNSDDRNLVMNAERRRSWGHIHQEGILTQFLSGAGASRRRSAPAAYAV